MLDVSQIAAVDIGSKYIKMVHGKKHRGRILITDCRMCSVNYDDITDSICGFFSEKSMKSKRLLTGMRGHDVIIRHTIMPVMKEKLISKAAELELGQYLQVDSGDYVIKSKAVNEVFREGKKMLDVLLVAVPRWRVEYYLRIANKLGLNLEYIDLFGNSITRFFRDEHYSRNLCNAVLDIGHKSSTVTLVEGSSLFFMKEISIGAKELISSACAFEDLCDSIMKVFDFYTCSRPGRGVDTLFLYGGGAMIDGAADFIGNYTGIKTKLFNNIPFTNVDWSCGDKKRDLNIYLNCISLFLRFL